MVTSPSTVVAAKASVCAPAPTVIPTVHVGLLGSDASNDRVPTELPSNNRVTGDPGATRYALSNTNFTVDCTSDVGFRGSSNHCRRRIGEEEELGVTDGVTVGVCEGDGVAVGVRVRVRVGVTLVDCVAVDVVEGDAPTDCDTDRAADAEPDTEMDGVGDGDSPGVSVMLGVNEMVSVLDGDKEVDREADGGDDGDAGTLALAVTLTP